MCALYLNIWHLLLHLLANASNPLLGAIAVLSGNNAFIHDDIDVKLVALLEAGTNFLEFVLNHEGKRLVKLHLALLLDSVACDLAALQEGLAGTAGLDIEQGADTVANGSNDSMLLFPNGLDNLVDLVVVGQVKERTGTTGETDALVLLRADLVNLAGALDKLHGLVVFQKAADSFIMLAALQAIGIKVALATTRTSKGNLILGTSKLMLLGIGKALVQVGNLLNVETGTMGLFLSQSKSIGITTSTLRELAGVSQDDEDLVLAVTVVHV